MSLDDVKRAKEALGVTVNDVVLTITGGALRRYLDARGELPEESLVAGVPVSTRSSDDKSIGNQITEVGMHWGTDEDDPVARARAIHVAASKAKAEVQEGPNLLEGLAESLVPAAIGLMVRGASFATESAPLPANAVVSNVRMTPFPLYIGGAQIREMVPLSMLAPTQGLNITVLSYCGELHFGITAEPNLVPEVERIADAIPKEMVELGFAIDSELKR
ncbi:WS/DGAT domain-containing protein [Methylobacterium sp.]|uniref:WS/DGAT domain-containing protein n=1 Tax=Methylobacterium sp. TaxID=409 RepID=UPI003B0213F3